MRKALSLFLVCLITSGCSEPGWILMSPAEKITKAFPPNAEVRIAEEGLHQALISDTAKQKHFNEQYASKLELRALTCSQGQTISRFDSITAIAARPINKDCLNDQDLQLLQFIGIQRIAIRLSQAALIPLTPLTQQAAMSGGGLADYRIAAAASSAGVAVLQGSRNEFISIELPSGKKIATFTAVPEYSQQTTLSPNGRVAAIRYGGRGLMFIDTESGEKLWDSREFSQFYAWLPEVSGALLQESKTNKVALVDLQTGNIEVDTLGMSRQSWASRIENQPGHILIGSNRDFSHIEFSRTGNEIKANSVRTYHLTQGQGVTSTAPTVMRNGKSIFFVSFRDFMTVDLETGTEKLWGTTDFLANRYAKLSETGVIVASTIKGDYRTKPWVLDIEQATLAPIDASKYPGTFSGLEGRAGFMRRDNQTWIGASIETGTPASLDTLLSAFNLERQLAKLDSPAQSGSFDSQAQQPSTITPVIATIPPSDGGNGLIANLARNAQIEALGVYEGAATTGRTLPNGRKMCSVEVRIRASTKPIVLVLSSYEPVRWNISMEPGARIPLVLVSGYYPSEVIGAGSARVLITGSEYAYKFDSPEYEKLNNTIRKQTGKSIGAFQGRYQGASFSVGG